jgi:DNA mismatch repair protein MutS
MMRQYRSIKSRHRDTILFFRLGDFYEMFEQDAAEASRILGLTLTQRNGVPMCGIPYHASQGYVARLLRAGKKIAICEQTLIPKSGLANREVIEVITPGTVTDENLLEQGSNNFLVCLARLGEAVAVASVDLSTADFQATHIPYEQRREGLKRELLSLAPKEILVQESLLEEDEELERLLTEQEGTVINRFPDWSFELLANKARLEKQLQVSSLKGFGLSEQSPEIVSLGVLLSYLEDNARNVLAHIRDLRLYSDQSHVAMDESTLRNLEIAQNLHDRSRRFTLLEVLDHTRCPMGARRLKRWLVRPLKELNAILARQELVGLFYKNQILLSKLREHFGRFYDLERLASRVALQKAHAKDLLALKSSLATVAEVTRLLEGHEPLAALLHRTVAHREALGEITALLERAILDEPSILLSEGNLIKPGFDPELDRLRGVKENARHLLRGYLDEERTAAGIPNLKLKYNRILGYFLEVTKSNLTRVPSHFVRRQTLVGGERYSTERLANLESDINNASERIVELEREHFLKVRDRVRAEIPGIQVVSDVIAELDVLQGFAFAATLHGYVKPQITEQRVLDIREGRHPVVEANLPAGSFVPNSLHLDARVRWFILLTGPNMAGKSTYLRQNALIVLMAQIGSFVPAAEATIGIVDQIFCRVGASDNLARGESTFLVEMSETANILRSATQRSLVIMDEVGRGTGTKDGLAIAWAVTEHILDHVGAFTLFATHYHELTALKHSGLLNQSMAVLERGGEIVFLKQIHDGPTDNSYGIHVARLAGIPDGVVRRAQQMLARLRGEAHLRTETAPAPSQPLLFSPGEVICDEIRALDLGRTTPLGALNRIAEWQGELRGGRKD